MKHKNAKFVLLSTVSALATVPAFGYSFNTGIGDLEGQWNTNLTGGLSIRTKSPSCSLTGDPNANNCGSAANTAQWANGDDGDLNYRKGQPTSAYLSLTSELLLTMPSEGYKFMIRGTGLYDFAAKYTDRTQLDPAAYNQLVRDVELLDLWGQKDFNLGDERAHVRVGNQVINWGESYFASGGINATNSLDIQKLLVPGTQLKQALRPAPMVSFASSLPAGFSTEAYLQWQWNGNKYPPVGGFWSASDVFGRGAQPGSVSGNNFNVSGIDAGTIAGQSNGGQISNGTLNATNTNLVNGAYTGLPTSPIGVPYNTVLPSNKPQYGVKLAYHPSFLDANFAFYYLNYTDKSPVITYLSNGTGQFSYLQNRQLFGLSTNFSIGDWAIGGELSYRPRDAVALTGCYGAGGPADANTNGVSGAECKGYKDMKKFQLDVNAQLNLTQSSYPFIKYLGADAAVFTAELTAVNYPGVSADSKYYSTINGQQVYQMTDAGYGAWLNNNSGLGYPIAAGQGTSRSLGMVLDFNWTYDGTLIHGWQVTPGITFSDSLAGYTPTLSANYMQGAKSINFYVLFNQNPALWQAGINYTMYWGGNSVSQPYADRNFVGLFVTRNF
ncbi:DUF1302 domain-containing protein [Paraburkholderia phymatum]|uniref:DUF1302 domain-containing protein n=1 Tax=Paraburkholderia phymatum (strain DSM 17167 / CIP 108236 / LMG 21445 / STM815) TaxID=391038 RepID=B2JSE9_PARP8|nr:DUF1302 domain-containing protein [Paraburkholderia phymatum]ACC73969.1 protein of unknown function DUF1302 [Paraburkholderia phymatum STM815]